MSHDRSKPPSEIRSEEIQDIISRPPGSFIRWGTLSILFIFLIFIVIAWLVKYPDVISADVTITTLPSPLIIVSRSSGKILLNKIERDSVNAGDLIANIESSASVQDVLALDKATVELLSTSASPHYRDSVLASIGLFKLGDLQASFTVFVKSERDWSVFKRNQLEEKQIVQLKRQIDVYQKLNGNQLAKQRLMEHELVLTKEKFSTDSILYSQGVISKVDFNQSKSVYIQQQRLLRSTEAEALNTQLQIAVLTKQIDETETSSLTKENQLATTRDQALKELQAQIKKWKDNFLLIAPVNGTVAYLEYLENSQHVDEGKNLFSIIPDRGEIMAKAEMPLAGSGKVKSGQQVNIQLDNYPFEQFGMLTGEVKTISLLPNDDKYLLALTLNHGMTSTHGKELPFRQQLKGKTEIITEDINIVERIFYQFRKLIRQR